MAERGRSLPVVVRIALLIFSFFGVCAVVGLWGVGFLRTGPPTVPAAHVTHTSSGTEADLTIQTVGSIGTGPRPTWVSYLVQNPQGHWVHSTVFKVPAHATINVTDYEYDGPTPIRNPFWSKVRGTVGGVAHVTGYSDEYPSGAHKFKSSTPYSQLDSAGGIAHSFTIPSLGVNVPLDSVSASVTNLCAVAPCSTKNPHTVVKFSFKTPGPGTYRWQCVVPCGLNFYTGNGGPMQTLGYMMGFIKVVNKV